LQQLELWHFGDVVTGFTQWILGDFVGTYALDCPVLDRWPKFRDLVLEDYEEDLTSLRKAVGIGRPLGTADFVTELERWHGRRDCPWGPRAEGCFDFAGRAVKAAAIGKLSPY
jgi:hypothetical protein